MQQVLYIITYTTGDYAGRYTHSLQLLSHYALTMALCEGNKRRSFLRKVAKELGIEDETEDDCEPDFDFEPLEITDQIIQGIIIAKIYSVNSW